MGVVTRLVAPYVAHEDVKLVSEGVFSLLRTSIIFQDSLFIVCLVVDPSV